MNHRMILFLAVMLLASPVRAREKADVIVMKNGDRITCEVKGLRSNTLYIKVRYIVGTLSVDWNNVDYINSKQLFIVRTQNGTVYSGALSAPDDPAKRPTQIEVLEGPDKKVTVDRKQVAMVDQTSNLLWERLNGQVGLGFSYTKGNQTSRYTLNSDLSYVEQRWSAGASYSSNLSSSAGANISTRNEVSITAQRLLRWNSWYYAGIADILQSSVLDIQRQTSLGGGIGRNIKNTGATFFTVYGGFAWQDINYRGGVVPVKNQEVAAGLLGTELRLFRFNQTTLSVSANLLPALSDPGRVHFNLNTSYYVKIWNKLDWDFTVYGNWDNRPPRGFAASDYGATSGLSIKFGNR